MFEIEITNFPLRIAKFSKNKKIFFNTKNEVKIYLENEYLILWEFILKNKKIYLEDILNYIKENFNMNNKTNNEIKNILNDWFIFLEKNEFITIRRKKIEKNKEIVQII